MNFKTLGLPDNLIEGLLVENITEPTDVQAQSIPPFLDNDNLIIQSETGSGKTLAYLLPIYTRMLNTNKKGLQAIILVPTQELAMQVYHQIERLSKNSKTQISSAVIMGNINIKRQIEKLKLKPEIIIGTCDRILELTKKKKIKPYTVETLIIDEADKMLSKENLAGVQAVRKTLMRDTQIIFTSASVTDKTLEKANSLANAPKFMKTSTNHHIPENINHLYIVCEKRDKVDVLRKLVNIISPSRGLVFINGTDDIEFACEKLKHHKVNCECIHGKSTKQERQKNLTGFTDGKIQLLIASDLASRGLQINNIDSVFSISISDDPMDYLHRAGRTGRNGKDGVSICIISDFELSLLTKYENKFNINIKEIVMKNGEILFANEEN